MPSVYWVANGKVIHEFKSQHMALGILEDDLFEATIETCSLPQEGFVFTYTDGLSEQENVQGEPFSPARVLAIVAQNPENLVAALADALQQHAGAKSFGDDVSICKIVPADVFAEMNLQPSQIMAPAAAARPSMPFEWHITLTGKKLEQCDIPPLCNHFLQQLTCDQALCQKIFAIMAEMVSNAIDHGVLKLSSALKENPNGFVAYFAEREERMKALTEHDFVKVSVQWDSAIAPKRLMIDVEDSGSGYAIKPSQAGDEQKFSGRGSQLIRAMAESVEVFPPGNKIRAIIL
jgi:two-component system, HptB-dependent secretion and biofilm response regulator